MTIGHLEWALDGEGLFFEASDKIAYLPREKGRASYVLRLDTLRDQEYRGIDPSQPHHILVTEKASESLFRLLRISRSGESEIVFEDSAPIHSFLLDGAGHVAYTTQADGIELVIRRRSEPSRRTGPGEEIYRCDPFRACGLLAIEPESPRVLLQARPEADRRELVALDPKTSIVELLHTDPNGIADLQEAKIDPIDGTLLLTEYDTDSLRSYGLTASARRHLDQLAELFPDGGLRIEPRAKGRPFWLVTQARPVDPNRKFYLYDTQRGRVFPILGEERLSPSVPVDSAGTMADKKHLTYRASDGRRVHGFVSLPQNAVGSAPMVALIHGGPWNHVRRNFDPLTQFLVSRGYVVFEPNFRGSTGYGMEYILAARGEFGDGRVHQDIVDGVNHLLGRGIGDRDRVAIMGHSFGGFSALGAIAFSPKVFKAGIASAPAIDLLRALEDLDDSVVLSNGLSQKEVVWNFVVDPEDTDGIERLRRNSPENRLEDTARPLLILAGAQDEKIALVDVRHYAASLNELGRDVSFVVDEDSGHSFTKPLLREAYLYLTECFLAQHVGGRAQVEATAPVREYLESRTILAGPSMPGESSSCASSASTSSPASP